MSADLVDESDSQWQIDLRWIGAVNAWFDGDAAPLERALRDGVPLNEDVRTFLADLVAGRVNRGKGGRPTERHGWVERSIAAEVLALRDTGMTADAAYAEVAQRRGDSESVIRGVVEKLRGQGITLERWRAWGRPDWKNR